MEHVTQLGHLLTIQFFIRKVSERWWSSFRYVPLIQLSKSLICFSKIYIYTLYTLYVYIYNIYIYYIYIIHIICIYIYIFNNRWYNSIAYVRTSIREMLGKDGKYQHFSCPCNPAWIPDEGILRRKHYFTLLLLFIMACIQKWEDLKFLWQLTLCRLSFQI